MACRRRDFASDEDIWLIIGLLWLAFWRVKTNPIVVSNSQLKVETPCIWRPKFLLVEIFPLDQWHLHPYLEERRQPSDSSWRVEYEGDLRSSNGGRNHRRSSSQIFTHGENFIVRSMTFLAAFGGTKGTFVLVLTCRVPI